MSFWRFISHSLTYHWRINLAVALSVSAATAVLVGALLVGDSVRGSLRALTLERLGSIDEVLVANHFFRQQLVDELVADKRFDSAQRRAEPLIVFPHATAGRQGGGAAARVLVVGCESGFWELDESGLALPTPPNDDQVVLNRTVADELGVEVGDQIVLRLPRGSQVPGDSPLAEKENRIRNVAGLEVVDIVPAQGLGQFSLRASQQLSRNVYIPLSRLQSALDQADQINAVVVAGSGATPLNDVLKPAVEDLGLALGRVQGAYERDGEESLVYDYFHLTTDRMILDSAVEQAADKAWQEQDGQGVLTYLANSIERLDGSGASASIPYSTVSAIEFGAGFPLQDADGVALEPLADDEIVLNSWAAADLEAKVGDRIRIRYFEPETTHGQATEVQHDFRLAAITPLTRPALPFRRRRPAEFDAPPTLANDPSLTPEVKGVTDQASIRNWDPPFPYDPERIRGADDEYWEYYRTTPKAFLSLATGKRLWGSRFGAATAIRVPAAEGISRYSLAASLTNQLRSDDESLGMEFTPIKQQQLKASQGTTPFDVLFLALSFFIIAAALMLVAMLFRLGIEQRATQVGVLLAAGWLRKRVTRCLVVEGLLVSALGAALGVAIGIGYAWLMVAGLRTWWVGAITTPFLQFHYSVEKLVLGYLLGLIICVATIWWSIRRMGGISVRRLLGGNATDAGSFSTAPQTKLTWLARGLLVLAVGVSAYATQLVGMPAAGAFFGAGASLLTGLLLLVWVRLRRGDSRSASSLAAPMEVVKLAFRNAARNPSRSALVMGLMASATFLIVAMSSFRLDPTDSGTGGFDLVGESAEALIADLGSAAQREEIFGEDVSKLRDVEILSLRQRSGDDASCNNLYKSSQPRVLGVTSEFIEHFDDPDAQAFGWAATEAEAANPWRLLAADADRPADGAIPVVIDMNTAMYSLGLPPGTGSEYVADYDGIPTRFRVVGLLENSLLQGSLIIGPDDFESRFSDISGYRYFLIQTAGSTDEVAALLEERFSDFGFDAISTKQVLEQLLAVQNTYLSTFQSLGALGLLLGTFGLAAVQLRSITERRGELALLRATGFQSGRIARMVVWENILLLLGGLGTGTVAAMLAVFPHKVFGEAAVSWRSLGDLALTLGLVFVVGVVIGGVIVRSALRAPVLEALRGD